MTHETTDAAASRPASSSVTTSRRTPLWLVVTICVAVGLFYAYAVWNAIGNLVQAAQLPTGLNGLGWFLWIFATVFPLVVFGIAFALGYRRRPLHLLLVMVTGLAVVAVFWLNVVAYSTLNTSALIGA